MSDQQKRIDDLQRDVAELERELKAAQETLHDQYTMAALTGLLATDNYALDAVPRIARKVAGDCMEARQA